MELSEIKELFKAFDESGSSYFEIKQDGVSLKLKKPSECKTQVVTSAPVVSNIEQAAAPVAIQPVQEEAVDGHQVVAPLVGVFYAAPSPDDEAYVQVGDKVEAGQTLCLIEAMKMMSEITAPKAGVIKKIYVKNQDVVGFEDPLFLIGD
jgi:acetyl-CoA carboxylase, biotin carboxyl carrier protein